MSNQGEKANMPQWFETALKRVDERVSLSTHVFRIDSFSSHCGSFSLTVDWHGTDGFTSCYEAVVRQKDRTVTTIRGECLQFWTVWLEQPTTQILIPYLPSCQVLIDCSSGAHSVFLDAHAGDAPIFRWLGVEQHPTQRAILAVEGRFDGSPCGIKLVDFGDVRHPKCLKYFDVWYSEFRGWVSDRAIRFVRNVPVRLRDNKKLDDMTDDELVSQKRANETTQYVDEVLDVDVSEILGPTWFSSESDPLIIRSSAPVRPPLS